MTPLDLLTNGFARVPTILRRATVGLDQRVLSAAPAPGANSIAWLSWHTARGQDAWISDLEGTPQRWTEHGWFGRFALPFDAQQNGFAMSAGDTALVRATGGLLIEYLDEVTARTIAYLAELTPHDLDVVVDSSRSPVVTRGIQLLSILDDNLQHAGQAAYARGILDHSRRSSAG